MPIPEDFTEEVSEEITAANYEEELAAIEKELARLERLASAQSAITAVEAAGGTAHYHSVDLTDVDAVAAVVDRIRESSGHIDVLLHAAGLEISRNLPEKEPGSRRDTRSTRTRRRTRRGASRRAAGGAG